jgi:hypothetical protein
MPTDNIIPAHIIVVHMPEGLAAALTVVVTVFDVTVFPSGRGRLSVRTSVLAGFEHDHRHGDRRAVPAAKCGSVVDIDRKAAEDVALRSKVSATLPRSRRRNQITDLPTLTVWLLPAP